MHGTITPPTIRQVLRDALAWLAGRTGRRVAGAALLLTVGQLALSAYDKLALGLPVVREEPAGFALHQIVQTGFLAGAAALLVAALLAARPPDAALDRESCGSSGLWIGALGLAGATGATCLFLADPAAFHMGAREDQPLEWASALLLFVGSGLLLVRAVQGRRDRLVLLAALGLAALLFLVGMEEISWGQRLFGFATPEELAEVNWQGEFNLHNVQTDLSETLYYVGAAFFLVLLPLLRDLMPAPVRALGLYRLLPRREVALVSAPLLWLNEGHWDLYAVQFATWVGIGALLIWGWVAGRRGDRSEAVLFTGAALLVVVGQALFLRYGPTLVDLPDPTEYKELFIALGFAWYGATARVGGSTAV